ncbi:glycoside hydrolase family 28 protein [Gonapodya prolifera JEL478]|uniref:Glycoside hydrolase family 28 protein n=1 Tax=Gonapodya prolifera (strain JEL478) TaxID=1344416 RepID=A0A139AEM1_GONPJ|nr:glycoside hydrolase family 28 protein [Gonapodya prolifera JEL478]|eukprot:KXS15208.1 glycoside hydrolase family 28 protein [Gonapodya prolifera JEL478]
MFDLLRISLLVTDNVSNGDIYNVLIRDHDEGGLDGLALSPLPNLLIEDVFCNQSGGKSMGSFKEGTAVENVHMRNIYSHFSAQFLMIKTHPNGNGFVRNCRFENFKDTTTAYGLQLSQYWPSSAAGPCSDTSGVQLSHLTFTNWVGLSNDASQRAPVFLNCSLPNPSNGLNSVG